MQHLQQLEPAVEHGRVGHVLGGDAAAVLVHDLLEPLQALQRRDVARRNGAGDDLVAAHPVGLERPVDHGLQPLDLGVVGLRRLAEVPDVVDRRLAGDAALGEGAGRELVGGAAAGVAGDEQALDRRHAVVAPAVVGRRVIVGAAGPGARARGVGAHDVGLGGGELGHALLGVDVLRGPHHRLADGHAEEVLPADLLLVRVLEGLARLHVDGAAAGLHLLEHGVVAQARRHRLPVDVVADHPLDLVVPLRLVLFVVGVLGVGLEMQEVGADRAVAVLEAGQHDAVLHLRHLGADGKRQAVGRGAAPRGIPRAPHALADGARAEDVGGAAGGDDHRLGPEDVEIAAADAEAHRPGDPVGVLPVGEQVGHHDPVVGLVRRLLGGLGDDRLVALAVDHDLPLALALVAPGLRVPHHRQAPLVELVHGGVDVPRDVVAEILAHQPHEVVARVADVVLGLVLAPVHPHVAVDGVETLGDGAAALDVRLLDYDDLLVASPVAGLVGGAAAAEPAADDEDVGVDGDRPSRVEPGHAFRPSPCPPGSAGRRFSGRRARARAPGTCIRPRSAPESPRASRSSPRAWCGWGRRSPSRGRRGT